ncbi:GNAT family N-acetyltransferase [Marinobacterium marinum]
MDRPTYPRTPARPSPRAPAIQDGEQKPMLRQFYDWCRSSYEAHGFGPWALQEKASGQLVGFCGVSPEPVEGQQEINLGYRLARQFWHQGFATEAVRGVMDYAFSGLALESVVVIIEPEHHASLRVAEKAGFSDYRLVEFHDRPVRLYRVQR